MSTSSKSAARHPRTRVGLMQRIRNYPDSRYILFRLGQGLLVLWGAFTVSFIVLYLIPGDAVSVLLAGGESGESSQVSEEMVAEMRAEFNLDRPMIVQYGLALWSALQLDFGASIMTGQDVVPLIGGALPETLKLSGLALIFSLILGVVVAVSATYARSPRLATFLAGLPALGVAVPTFWVGLLLLQLFSFQLGWFPAIGNSGAESLILPALTLAIPNSAVIAQVLLRSLDDIWKQPYILALQGKGLTRLELLIKHGLRNAVIPALSLSGVIAGNFLAGTVVVETVFTREGIGRLTQMGVQTQDLPLVQGIVVFAAFVFVVTSLVVDLLYPLIDPRLRRQTETSGTDTEETSDSAQNPALSSGGTLASLPAGGAAVQHGEPLERRAP